MPAGTTPICELETNACVPCTEHEQCGEAACNLYTGACLPGDAVVHVGGRKPDFATLGDAVESFGEGAEGTIVVHGGKATAFNESVTVDGGRLLAFVAAELGPGVEPPRWIRSSGNAPQLTVSADATVLLDGLQLSSNASSMVPGVLVDGGRAWMDRSRIVTNLGGGIVAQAGAELTLRNCFVGQDINNVDALLVDGASARVSYSTLAGGTFNAAALRCASPLTVNIRSSILVTQGGSPPDEVVCPLAAITYSATEGMVVGEGNESVGAFPGGMADLWFADYLTGDFHLQNDGLTLFADVAQWHAGDPPTDIDGEARPTNDGDLDYAGADVP